MSFYFTKILVLFLAVSTSFTNSQNPSSSSNEVSNSLTKHSSEIDEILNWEPPLELKKNMPYVLSGFDHDRCPVWVVEIGKWDIRGQIETFGLEQVQKYITQMFVTVYTSAEPERLSEFQVQLANLGNNQTESGEMGGCENFGYSGIGDFDGFSYRQMAYPPTLRMFVHLAQTIFSYEGKSQRLKGLFGINFNYLAQAMYTFAGPFLGKFRSIINIYSTNPDQWKPKLLKAFPKSSLPEYMGGSQDFKPLRIYG